jgi:two-component system sensor histidine kinase KdpD
VAIAVGASVALSTVAVAALERFLNVPNASSVYVVAVAGVAIAIGIAGAALTAVLGVLVYDFLFTHPLHTLVIADSGEWLNLVLLLFVAVTVGQLAALQRRRAEVAVARDLESRTLVEVTRALATRESTRSALPAVIESLARAARMDAVWISIGADDAEERMIARTPDGAAPGPPRTYFIVHREADGRARWTLVRSPGVAGAPRGQAHLFRVRIESSGRTFGSIWAERGRGGETPDSRESAVLLVAADLVGQALAHDRLAEETRRAEIARQSDAVKTALLESVSHNLRTPLASIRASAGTLMDPEVQLTPEDARASAESIDQAAQRLNRLVGNLLDLSRIEGGALRAAHEAVDLEEVVSRAAGNVRPSAGRRRIELAVQPGTTVLGDPVLLEEAIVNLLENAVLHTPQDASARAMAHGPGADGSVRLTIEDSGPGVPDVALERIFEKFYQGAGRRVGSSGSGIGLAVVRGFVEAMGGRVAARRGVLGGLAVDIDLPAVPGGSVGDDGDEDA